MRNKTIAFCVRESTLERIHALGREKGQKISRIIHDIASSEPADENGDFQPADHPEEKWRFFVVRVSSHERENLIRAAKKRGVSLSKYLRDEVLKRLEEV